MQLEVVVTWRHQQLAPLLLLLLVLLCSLLLLACVAPWQTRHLCARARHRHVRTAREGHGLCVRCFRRCCSCSLWPGISREPQLHQVLSGSCC